MACRANTRLRCGLAVAVASSLAWPVGAFGAYDPQLAVSSSTPRTGATGVTVGFTTRDAGDDATARLTVFVPLGYAATLDAAPGAQVGSASGNLVAPTGAVVPAAGTITAASPFDLGAAALACTGAATHAQTLLARIAGGGLELDVPLFVDPVTSAPANGFASQTIAVCPPAGDLKLAAARLTLTQLANPRTHGSYRWRALATPFAPGTAAPNEAAGVELQSLVGLPTSLSIAAKVTGRAKRIGYANVSLTARLLSNLHGVNAGPLQVLTGAAPRRLTLFERSETNAHGVFDDDFSVKQGSRASRLYVQAKGVVEVRDLGPGACIPTAGLASAPLPCADATIGPFSVTSNLVRVLVPRRPR